MGNQLNIVSETHCIQPLSIIKPLSSKAMAARPTAQATLAASQAAALTTFHFVSFRFRVICLLLALRDAPGLAARPTAKATLTASRVAATLCVRTMLAPDCTHSAAAAALATSRSSGSLWPALQGVFDKQFANPCVLWECGPSNALEKGLLWC